MKRLFILFASLCIVTGLMFSCKKKTDAAKTGSATFSSASNPSLTYCTFTVTVNGQTGTFTQASNQAPACGTVSSDCAVFSLPVGTYTFTITGYDGSHNYSYHGPNSVTVTDNGCSSVRATYNDW